MNFLSLEYYVVLLVSVAIFYNLNPKFRTVFLLILSLSLYAYWNKFNALILIVISILMHLFATLISRKQAHKKIFFFLGLFIILTIYLFFKLKTNILVEGLWNYGKYKEMLIVASIMPLGISFYTFQAISYLVDVYKDKRLIEKKFINSLLYLSFFPQLTAGPIERGAHLLPQINRIISSNFNKKYFYGGLELIALGLFKKFVLADNLRPLENLVDSDPELFYGAPFFITAFISRYATFLDLFAYIDIAQGSAKLFGINLVDNFKQPFLAKSPTEFWRKFHISLVSWFWNYTYLPLCRIFPGIWGVRFIAILTFVLVGFWHHIGLVFLVWGILHGVIFFISSFLRGAPSRILEKIFLKRFKWIRNILIILGTQLLLTIPMIIGKHFSSTYELSIKHLIDLLQNDFLNKTAFNLLFQKGVYLKYQYFFIILLLCIILEIIYYFYYNHREKFNKFKQNFYLKLFIYFTSLILFIKFGNIYFLTFIYYQF